MNGPVLYVENDENDVFLFNRALRRIGFEYPLASVRSGREAIAYLQGAGEFADRRRHPEPVLLVVDLKMPEMSGIELLRWVRAQPPFAMLPVLILSSSAQRTDIREASAAGANAYAIKPGTPRELQETLAAIRDEVFRPRLQFGKWPVAFNQCEVALGPAETR